MSCVVDTCSRLVVCLSVLSVVVVVGGGGGVIVIVIIIV